MSDTQHNSAIGRILNWPQSGALNTRTLFCILWVLLFALYYPAAKAGFVTDFTGWLDQVRNHGFGEYINRTNFKAHSLYQFTQLMTFIFYKIFGTNPWLWHLLFITLHTINACLLFNFSTRLLDDAGVRNSKSIGLAGVLLFCVSPYISEVLVWEPSFHFLQGLLFILLILTWVQRYLHTGDKKYVLFACLIYALSLFSLEIFYITPWLVLTMVLFYRFIATHGKQYAGKAIQYFFVPLILLFVMRLVGYYMAYGEWVSRIGSGAVAGIKMNDFGKPAKYLFHLIFLGRFFPNDGKRDFYNFCDSSQGVMVFYGGVLLLIGFMIYKFRSLNANARVVLLFLVWTLTALALLVPLWFGDSLLVLFDRYTYFTAAFFYMLVAVAVSLIPMQYARILVIAVFALANLRFAIQVSRYWGKSEYTSTALLHNLPAPGNKTVILLNLPESIHGIPMIGSQKEGEFKLMHNLLLPERKLDNKIYDVLSYNMERPDNGAYVIVLNDSMVRVTLKQWGTWWWYEGKGGHSYENEDYKLNLIDAGHFYELTLKKPAANYLLLFQAVDKWVTVDMNKKQTEQY